MAADVVIGYVHDTEIDGVFHDSLIAMLFGPHVDRVAGVIATESGPCLVPARNGLAQSFLHSGHTWLLSVDADMELPVDLIPRLMRHATPNRIVSGLYFAWERRNRRLDPLMWDENMTRIKSWEPGALVPVRATGAGAMLIHRNVFERTPKPWYTQSVDGKWGEDQHFCFNAINAGFSVAVDTSTILGHSKGVIIGAEDWRPQEVS